MKQMVSSESATKINPMEECKVNPLDDIKNDERINNAKDITRELWNKAVTFHGHECGGLTIGYKAALYAIELMNITFSKDEDIVCVSENDACGVDAIQAILGCSAGKGNLLFHIRGKQAFSFYNRKNGKSIRLVLKPRPEGMTRKQSFEYYQKMDAKELFEVKKTTIKLPESARMFDSYICECCGESTGANWIRLAGEKKVCLDCYEVYDRFNI